MNKGQGIHRLQFLYLPRLGWIGSTSLDEFSPPSSSNSAACKRSCLVELRAIIDIDSWSHSLLRLHIILPEKLRSFANCNEPLTVLSHFKITFTSRKAFNPLPTVFADNGAPALKCAPKLNPAGAVLYAKCPLTANSTVARLMKLSEYYF